MKLVVLTTQTLHHTYFVRELTYTFSIEAIFVERKTNKACFDTHHPFEDKRELYEKKELFNNKELTLPDLGFVNGYKSLYKAKDTFFENIKELPHACNMLIDNGLSPQISSYWKPEFNPQSINIDQAIQGFRQRLFESNRLRLRADERRCVIIVY